jgi:enolase
MEIYPAWGIVLSGLAIRAVRAREVLDCRGNPTVEVDVVTEAGVVGRADVPAGRSRGEYEAFELRDGDKRYCGVGVLKACRNVNEIIGPRLIGIDVRRQADIDQAMLALDGTESKSRLGGNAIVGVSLAAARAAANALGLPLYRYVGGPRACVLPVPFLNYINGGKLAATDLDFQEHIIVPVGAKTFSEAMAMSAEVYFLLGQKLARRYSKYVLNTADEGGYTPPMRDPRDALEAELDACEELGYGGDFVLALDCAATHFYDANRGVYRFMGGDWSRERMMDFYEDLCKTYPIASIEDPLQQDDFEGFAELTKTLNIQIIGDDLFATNLKRISRGISMGAANALLWKVNQVGTLTEALDAAARALRHGYGLQVSERSGQTEDSWLADLAVALNAGQIKTGAPCRGERTAQYNQLLRIEEELGSSAIYPGRSFRKPI